MQISTARFGTVHVEPDDIFLFANGLVGFEHCCRWVLLADADNPAIGWMQSASHPEIAVAVVSPRRFVPDYQAHVSASQLAALELDDLDRAFVLNVLAKNNGRLTINLRAPLIFNLDRRLGRQVVTTDRQPLQLDLFPGSAELRKTA